MTARNSGDSLKGYVMSFKKVDTSVETTVDMLIVRVISVEVSSVFFCNSRPREKHFYLFS